MLNLIIVALLSSAAGALVSVGLLPVTGEPPSFEDAAGVFVFTFVPSLLFCALFYAPGLFWLRRRRGGCRPPYLFPLVSASLLNLPAAALLAAAILMGNLSGAHEVALFLPAYVVAGLLFGLGFVNADVRGRRSDVS